MPGFKMAFGAGGAAARPRGATALSSSITCFQEEEASGGKGLGKGGTEEPSKVQEPAAGGTDPLDAFMADLSKEAAKPCSVVEATPAAKPLASWEELQADDPVTSYYEVYEKRKRRRKAVAGADGEAAEGSGSEVDADAAGCEREGEEEDSEEEEGDRRSKPIEPLPPVDHEKMEYKLVKTDFYTPHVEIAGLTAEEVDTVRKDLEISVTGADCPRPGIAFGHFGLPKELMEGIRRHGYTKPTPIQAQAIPAGLSGRDIIGLAETGSGKTVAFLMPLLVHCAAQEELKKDEGPIGLVMCPTRELAVQTEREVFKFNAVFGLRSTTLAGGLSKYRQFKEMKRKSEIVIATPGRLIDIVKMKGCTMARVTFLVLDEADRMLQMGFEAQIRSIMQNVQPARQTLLFSATFPPRMEKISRDLLRQPVRITVGTLGQAAANVKQHVEVLANEDAKWAWLATRVEGFLAQGQLLVFAKSKQAADVLHRNFVDLLQRKAVVLRGDLGQDERMQVLDSFRKRRVDVLVATDIAARGLDVRTIRTVVSYDVARDIETHTHRVGRTGRAGGEGDAYTLLTPDPGTRKTALRLLQHLQKTGHAVGQALCKVSAAAAGAAPRNRP